MNVQVCSSPGYAGTMRLRNACGAWKHLIWQQAHSEGAERLELWRHNGSADVLTYPGYVGISRG